MEDAETSIREKKVAQDNYPPALLMGSCLSHLCEHLSRRRKKDTQTLRVARTSREAVAAPDPSWRGLYRVGAVSAVLYVVLIIIPLVLMFTTPQPPLAGGAATLEYIASHKLVYLIELVSFVGLSPPALIVMRYTQRISPCSKPGKEREGGTDWTP
jgi:hypothetical protein